MLSSLELRIRFDTQHSRRDSFQMLLHIKNSTSKDKEQSVSIKNSIKVEQFQLVHAQLSLSCIATYHALKITS